MLRCPTLPPYLLPPRAFSHCHACACLVLGHLRRLYGSGGFLLQALNLIPRKHGWGWWCAKVQAEEGSQPAASPSCTWEGQPGFALPSSYPLSLLTQLRLLTTLTWPTRTRRAVQHLCYSRCRALALAHALTDLAKGHSPDARPLWRYEYSGFRRPTAPPPASYKRHATTSQSGRRFIRIPITRTTIRCLTSSERQALMDNSRGWLVADALLQTTLAPLLMVVTGISWTTRPGAPTHERCLPRIVAANSGRFSPPCLPLPTCFHLLSRYTCGWHAPSLFCTASRRSFYSEDGGSHKTNMGGMLRM